MSSKVEASAHERGHNAVNKKARKIWLSLALYLVREKTADDLKLTSLKLCACVHVHYVWPQFLLAGIQASALPNARTLLVAMNAVLKNYIFCLFVLLLSDVF